MISKDKLKYASSKLVEYLNKYGSYSERDLTIGGDTYKPFYRAIALLIAPTHPFLSEILDGQVPTIEEAKIIVLGASPFFVDALDRDAGQFEATYRFIKEAWE